MTLYRKKGQIDLLEKVPTKEKPFDWDALFGFILLAFIALAVLGSCTS